MVLGEDFQKNHLIVNNLNYRIMLRLKCILFVLKLLLNEKYILLF